jgi:CRISPR type I-D-associated protein Csc2
MSLAPQNTNVPKEIKDWLEKKNLKPFLRALEDKQRIFPNGKKIEVVFVIQALNLLLLRTEGAGDINEASLPESGMSVPVIQPQKLMSVTRRRLLQVLRMYRDSCEDSLKEYIDKAKKLSFKKAEEHENNGWNCTIQPPLASKGEKATDLGMDGYCPACTIFGVTLTSAQLKELKTPRGDISLGLKTRVHFDPAFATSRMIQPETHNKVLEGNIATTGGSLFTEIHVMPGTIFIGRAVMHDLTWPELLAVLYTLSTIEEIGGRAGVYGTIKVELLGIRGGTYTLSSSLELADEVVKSGYKKPTEIVQFIRSKLKELGFHDLSNNEVLGMIDLRCDNGTFKHLWASSLAYVKQVVDLVEKLKANESEKSKDKKK